MRKPFRKLGLLVSVLMVVFAVPGLRAQPPEAREAVLTEGSDCWQTEPGTEQRLHTIPAGFFGAGSQAVPRPTIKFKGVPLPIDRVRGAFPGSRVPPFNCGCPEKVDTRITWLDPHGNPTNDMRHAVTQVVDESTRVDTCVRRTTRSRLRVRGAHKVSIQLVALSLQSVDPLKVTYKHPGAPDTSKDFDVFVTESGRQRIGNMTLRPTSIARGRARGDVRLGSLHVNYDVKFVERGGTATFTMTNQRLQLVRTPGTFEQL